MFTLSLIQILNLFWMFAWIIIFLATWWHWENYGFSLSLLVWYIILWPIYKRWDILLNSYIFPLPSFWFSLMMLIFLSLFLFYILGNLLGKFSFTKKPSFSEKFSKIWLTWLDLILYFPIDQFCNISLDFFQRKLNTKSKLFIFFGFFIILPRIIVLGALLYDINIENALYWSPRLSLLLLISLIFRMFFTLLEKYAIIIFSDLSSLFFFEPTELTSESKQTIYEMTGKTNFTGLKFKLRLPCKIPIMTKTIYNTIIEDWKLFLGYQHWCRETKEFLHLCNTYLAISALSVQILCQIAIILNYYI